MLEQVARAIDGMIEAASAVLGVDTENLTFAIYPLDPMIAAKIQFDGEDAHITINMIQAEDMPVHVSIAHEMIHYKQWLEGRLLTGYDKDKNRPWIVWEGEEYHNVDSMSHDLPWEREAHDKMWEIGERMVQFAMNRSEDKSAA